MFSKRRKFISLIIIGGLLLMSACDLIQTKCTPEEVKQDLEILENQQDTLMELLNMGTSALTLPLVLPRLQDLHDITVDLDTPCAKETKAILVDFMDTSVKLFMAAVVEDEDTINKLGSELEQLTKDYFYSAFKTEQLAVDPEGWATMEAEYGD